MYRYNTCNMCESLWHVWVNRGHGMSSENVWLTCSVAISMFSGIIRPPFFSLVNFLLFPLFLWPITINAILMALAVTPVLCQHQRTRFPPGLPQHCAPSPPPIYTTFATRGVHVRDFHHNSMRHRSKTEHWMFGSQSAWKPKKWVATNKGWWWCIVSSEEKLRSCRNQVSLKSVRLDF